MGNKMAASLERTEDEVKRNSCHIIPTDEPIGQAKSQDGHSQSPMLTAMHRWQMAIGWSQPMTMSRQRWV
jgi:hypothetical protein